MATRSERYLRFLTAVVQLQSFPVVLVYLALIPASLIWKRYVVPFDLRKVMVVYNFLCSAMSLYSIVCIVQALTADGVSMFDMAHNPLVKQAFFVYWMTKYIELLDTIFMMLRHKQRQVSFLHVYHHSTILLLADYSYNYVPWPAISFGIGLNSFVHVFLYLYYGQSALYPGQRPFWKRRLTELQLLQFLVGLVDCTIGYLYHGFCVYGIFYGISMMGLFGNFYYHAYLKRSPSKKLE